MVNRSRTMADVGGMTGTRKQDNSSSSTYTDRMRAYFAAAHDTGLSHSRIHNWPAPRSTTSIGYQLSMKSSPSHQTNIKSTVTKRGLY
ncbi:hypothetical protein HZ326_24426 [Fusarium oxysporum f. sp. albedinis]|nr:hypothetical protein HZ326_24426 [Fusarium oxysporum f. sp. albedinis]